MPTVWLLEGFVMYLSMNDTKLMMEEVGRISAPGSAIFHDAVSVDRLTFEEDMVRTPPTRCPHFFG